MKILYIHTAHENSNMANLIQVKAMCKAMVQEGHQIILSLIGDKRKSYVTKDGYIIATRKSLYKYKSDFFIGVVSFLRLIREFKPDYVFTRNLLIIFFISAFTKTNILFESHNNILHYRFRLLNKFYWVVLFRNLQKGQIVKVITISDALKNYWVSQGIEKQKIITAHDGVDLDLFVSDISKEEAKKNLNLPFDKYIITYSGRLYVDRKIDDILILAKSFPDELFLIVGGPNENANVLKQEAKSKDIENILFTGQIQHKNVPLYLAASDILLALWSSKVVTIDYCSPLKLFEYMASKRLMLAHGFPTIKEVLDNETDALLVKPDSIEDLKSKLHIALTHPDKRKIEINAFKKVERMYTWRKRVQLIFESLE